MQFSNFSIIVLLMLLASLLFVSCDAIDSCLDKGGCWNEIKKKCVFDKKEAEENC